VHFLGEHFGIISNGHYQNRKMSWLFQFKCAQDISSDRITSQNRPSLTLLPHFYFLKSDVNVLVFKKLQGKFSSTAKYRLANKEDEEEKQDKEEEN